MIDWTETQKRFKRSDLSGRRPMVSVKCDLCGVLGSKTIINKSLVNGSQYDWVCKSCSLRRQWADGHFANHSENLKNRWQNGEYKKIFQTKEFRNKKRKQSKAIWSDVSMRQKAQERSNLLWRDEEFRKKSIHASDPQKSSESSKNLWKSDQYRRKVTESVKKSLNSEEFRRKSMLSQDEFISKAIALHGRRYDYSLVEYRGYHERVKIVCSNHGVFEQLAINHLQGCGCPKCPKPTSLQQKELIEFLKSLKCGVLENDRELIKPYEIDLLIPDFNLAIEYNGIYWHSHNKKESNQETMKHSNKHDLCLDRGYKLIQINEDEWVNQRPIVESLIRNAVGVIDQIPARKCRIINLSNEQHHQFMHNNHLQGGKDSPIRYGLIYNDEIVSAMSFSKHHRYQWEIARFANKIGLSVIGGASKLFKHFTRMIGPDTILTYADRRYSVGNLYRKLGFVLDGVTKPNYGYVKGNFVFSRQQFQKHKLKNKLESFDPSLTEAENMFNNGYRRLWDAGHYRFVWGQK